MYLEIWIRSLWYWFWYYSTWWVKFQSFHAFCNVCFCCLYIAYLSLGQIHDVFYIIIGRGWYKHNVVSFYLCRTEIFTESSLESWHEYKCTQAKCSNLCSAPHLSDQQRSVSMWSSHHPFLFVAPTIVMARKCLVI